jgi:hypothetical protein
VADRPLSKQHKHLEKACCRASGQQCSASPLPHRHEVQHSAERSHAVYGHRDMQFFNQTRDDCRPFAGNASKTWLSSQNRRRLQPSHYKGTFSLTSRSRAAEAVRARPRCSTRTSEKSPVNTCMFAGMPKRLSSRNHSLRGRACRGQSNRTC